MMVEKTIQRLRELREDVKSVENCHEFDDWREVAMNTLQNIFPTNKNVVRSIDDIVSYEFYDDDDDGEDVTENAIESAVKILNGLIKDVKLGFGLKTPVKPQKTTPPLHVTNNINQNSHQSVDIELKVKQQVDIKLKFFAEIFKHELTGRQLQELKDIEATNEAPEVKKQRFFDKVKSFGLDVTAGVLSGILANPDFIQQLTH